MNTLILRWLYKLSKQYASLIFLILWRRFWQSHSNASHSFILSTYLICIFCIWILKVFCFSQHFNTLFYYFKRNQKLGFYFGFLNKPFSFTVGSLWFQGPEFQKSMSILLISSWKKTIGKARVIISMVHINWSYVDFLKNWCVNCYVSYLIDIILVNWNPAKNTQIPWTYWVSQTEQTLVLQGSLVSDTLVSSAVNQYHMS